MAAGEASTARPRQEKQYDYLLKFLLVGDSDVGKQEILSGLEDGAAESPFCSGSGTTSQRFPPPPISGPFLGVPSIRETLHVDLES